MIDFCLCWIDGGHGGHGGCGTGDKEIVNVSANEGLHEAWQIAYSIAKSTVSLCAHRHVKQAR